MNVEQVKINGIKWGPFRLRIPFIHIKFRTAEFLQGMIISGATAFAGIPIAMGMGLSFEEGVALMLENIDYWKEAPVWDPSSIEIATQDWFKYLGTSRDG